jgi:putative CocE/NonD family hydrolase
MSKSIHIDTNVPMKMRDGVALRADIYRPDDTQKHPAILSRLMSKMLGHVTNLEIINAVAAGYALISQVCRGKGASEGEWAGRYLPEVEGPDGYDSVEWIASQPWCDGNVGMSGYSHGGIYAWYAAMENPPHLKAIAPWSSAVPGGTSKGVPPFSGGAIHLSTTLNWLMNESVSVVDRFEKEGQDVSEMRRALEWMRNNPEEYIYYLPLKDTPLARFERIGEMWQWRLHGAPNSARGEGSPFKKITIPVSHQCGWYDNTAWTSIQGFLNMRAMGASSFARENQHLLIGPWSHKGENLSKDVAGMNFGPGVGGPYSAPGVISPPNYLIEFFDKYLKGKDIKIPTVRYFLMGRNQWQEADNWPPPGIQRQKFFLHSKGKANTANGDGLLSRDEPGSESPDRFVYDPFNPVPTVGGPSGSPPAGFGYVSGPMEQSGIERRPDILCYTTHELKEDIEITGGPLEVHIFASTSVKSTDFTAKLVYVYPDGRSYNVAEGVKRITNQQESGLAGIKEYVIGIGNISQLFRKGHRIRIDISSSNFPFSDRNMNTGNPIGEDARGVPAMQTIYHQKDYASYIDLPLAQHTS